MRGCVDVIYYDFMTAFGTIAHRHSLESSDKYEIKNRFIAA